VKATKLPIARHYSLHSILPNSSLATFVFNKEQKEEGFSYLGEKEEGFSYRRERRKKEEGFSYRRERRKKQ